MLDSGASTTFLSETFAKRHRVATTPLTTPIALYNADGSANAIGQITHEAHLIMRIGMHQECIIAAVANTGGDDLILGVDWLRHHNPEIDWATGDVQFTYCQAKCQTKERLRRMEISESDETGEVEGVDEGPAYLYLAKLKALQQERWRGQREEANQLSLYAGMGKFWEYS